MNPAEAQLDILIRVEECRANMDLRFFTHVSDPWVSSLNFSHFLYWPMLERLGPRMFLPVIYRAVIDWRMWMEAAIETPAWKNKDIRKAILDAFHSSLVAGSLLEVQPEWELVKLEVEPIDDAEMLLEVFWDTQTPVDETLPTLALRIALNMFRQSDG